MHGLKWPIISARIVQDIVVWNGERGKSFFFQAELPYDVESYPYSGYAVAPTVTTHEAHGAGVYHYFRDFNVTVARCSLAAHTRINM